MVSFDHMVNYDEFLTLSIHIPVLRRCHTMKLGFERAQTSLIHSQMNLTVLDLKIGMT